MFSDMPRAVPNQRRFTLADVRPLVVILIGWAIFTAIRAVVILGPADWELLMASAQVWRSDGNPYAPVHPNSTAINLNPPILIWLLAPATTLPSWLSTTIWTALNIGGFGVALWWIARAGLAWEAVALAYALPLTGVLALTLGQVTGVLLPALVAAWLADRSGRPWAAGLWFGLALAVKPFLGLWLVTWALRRRWPAVWGAVIVANTCFLGSALIDARLTGQWLDALRSVAHVTHPLNASLAGGVARLGGSQGWTLGLIAIVLGVTLWRARTLTVDQHWSAVGTAALLVSPLGWPYYVPWITAPLVHGVPWRRWVGPALLLMIPPTVLLAWPLLGGSLTCLAVGGLWIASLAVDPAQVTGRVTNGRGVASRAEPTVPIRST